MAKFVTRRPVIIGFQGGFHGRTMGAVSVTSSKVHYREGYEPFMPSSYLAPFPDSYRCPLGHAQDNCCRQCLPYLERLFERVIDPHSVAGMLIEPVLGEGGYVPAPAHFLKGLRELCNRYGILLIFDEVQTGFGRTGEWWASQHSDVVPDIHVMAKAIASGFPLSAISSTRELMEKWHPGAHGSTFGGNPVSCAAACATIDAIRDEGMIENAARQGERLQRRLRLLQHDFPIIGDVRGLGLMVAVEFVEPGGNKPSGALADAVRTHVLKNNMIMLTCGLFDHCVRFIPPLNVSDSELDEGIEKFSTAVKDTAGRFA
jgi:4-aminobutyrate aminotransferase